MRVADQIRVPSESENLDERSGTSAIGESNATKICRPEVVIWAETACGAGTGSVDSITNICKVRRFDQLPAFSAKVQSLESV